MLARTLGATPWGVDARPVEVEVDARFGLPKWQMVGLPDTAVKESRERVASALQNSGFPSPPRVVVVNLAPADLRKEGNYLDLPIAVALLAAHERLPPAALERRLLCGELGLDGSVRPVRGAIAIASLARSMEVREVLMPREVAAQAACVDGCRVIPVASLTEAVAHLHGARACEPACRPVGSGTQTEAPDLRDVRGQLEARRALELAAAGGHNLLLTGPPGSGKTMLARRMPGLLPALEGEEAVTITKIQSLALARPPSGLAQSRPFRSPHCSISTAGLIGGGAVPKPGEVSLAHGGVLFLDELPEFRRDALEALRQPLEDGVVAVARAKARFVFPARFCLVAAMNPCRCGFAGDARHDCRCTPHDLARYRSKLSGPLLDRIDLHVSVPAVPLQDLRQTAGESSSDVRERVEEARKRQLERWCRLAPTSFRAHPAAASNAAVPPGLIDTLCDLTPSGRRLLERAYDRHALSLRAVHRTQRVARTIADLAGDASVGRRHVAEALLYRAAAVLGS